MKKATFLVITSVIFLLTGLWPQSNVAANGVASAVIEETTQHYQITIGATPSQATIGRWHMNFAVSDIRTQRALPDVDVSVQLLPPLQTSTIDNPAESFIQLYVAKPCPRSLPCRDLDVIFDQVGQWTIVVIVTGPHGENTLEFPVDVRDRNLDLGRITMNGVLVILLALILWTSRYWWGKGIFRSKNPCESRA